MNLHYIILNFMHTEYIKERDEWISWWGHQRNGIEKGFLNLPVDYGGD